jgi:signal transduction histidine kinase/putative methionine-R-sulfoxide reductase with GAF domain
VTTHDATREFDAERHAGLIFAHRESILEQWCDLIQVDNAEPASQFIRSQLDASILALANWFLGIDPFESTMGLQWSGIKPSSEMTIGAIVSMSVLPEAVRTSVPEVEISEHRKFLSCISEFVAEMTQRLLNGVNLEFDEDRWDRIARDLETRYETQRVQRIRRLELLIEIAHAVSTGHDLDALLDQVQQSVTQLSGSDYVEVSLLDQASGLLRCYLVYSKGERQPELEQTLISAGLARIVQESGAPLAVTDYASACAERGIPPSTALTLSRQRAWMGAPMRQGEQVVGVIAVSGELTSYEPEDIELLAAVARQTAVALENRRLIEAQRRHVAQLKAVNHLARETADLRDAPRLMQIAAEHIHDYFNYGLVTVFRTSPGGDSLIMQARSPVGVEEEHEARTISITPGSIVGDVALKRSAALYPDVHQVDIFWPTRSTQTTRSEMTVPIIHSGNLLGVLDVQSDHPNAFDGQDLTTLQTIADQLSVGLETSRLFAGEAQRTRELRLMLDTTRAASSSLLLDEVLERLAEGLAGAAGTSNCLIHLYDPDERCFTPAVLYQPHPDEASEMFADWYRSLPADEWSELAQVLSDPFPQILCPFPPTGKTGDIQPSAIVVPLRTRQRTLGLAIVASTITPEADYPLEQMRLLQGVADSAALAVENARLYARAHGLAIAEERGRLAQEIHDTLAQGLTAISLQLDLADSYLPDHPEQAARNVHRALDLTRQNLDEARRSVLDLRAADVHQMSLPDAVSQLLRRLGDDCTMNFTFENDGLVSRLSARVEVGLYRIIEEALENARRHSKARRVRVDIQADGKTVAVIIDDDGQGFDPAQLSRGDGGEQGFGLLGIRERARLLGGSLAISSTPGLGTSLRVVVPYEARIQPSYTGLQDERVQS